MTRRKNRDWWDDSPHQEHASDEGNPMAVVLYVAVAVAFVIGIATIVTVNSW